MSATWTFPAASEGAGACMFLLMLRDAALLAELRALIARHARPDESTALERVLLSAAGRPGEPRASTTGTVMAVIAQGAKRLAIGDRVYDYGPGQYLVASVDLPITGHYTHASARRAGTGLRPRPPARDHRVGAARCRRGARAPRAGTPGARGRGRAARAPRRRRAHGPPARRARGSRVDGADDRARDHLADAQRPARRERPPGRARRQQPHARESRGPVDHRALRRAVPGR